MKTPFTLLGMYTLLWYFSPVNQATTAVSTYAEQAGKQSVRKTCMGAQMQPLIKHWLIVMDNTT